MIRIEVNHIFNSVTYLIQIDKFLYLIDCGDSKPIKDYIKSNRLILKGVFLTHTHFDHIYGLNDLLEEFSNLIVYTSEYGKECLFSDKMNLSIYRENSFIYNGSDVRILHEGDRVQIFNNIFLNVIETPGHCLSCLTYFTDNYIFTGDSYIPGLKVVTELPKGNKDMAIQSMNKILNLSISRKVYSGHL